jgi:LacI family transcriptional regulator
MLGLRASGLVVGRDISVVGFDDIAEATLWRPSLTTVAVARQQVAKTAVEMLLQRIEDFDAPTRTVLLPTKLVVRETTGAPIP